MGYPWELGDKLTHADLNAKFASEDASIAAMSAQVTLASSLANNASSRVGPVSVTLSLVGTVVTGTYVLTGTAPYPFLITSVDASVGNNGGSLTALFTVDGFAVGALSPLSVTQATKTRTLVAGANISVAAGAVVSVTVTPAGSPANAYLVLNGTRT